MGIKSILLSLTALVLGVLLLPNVVSAQTPTCTTTKPTLAYSGPYTYRVSYPAYGSSLNCVMNIGAKGLGVKSLQTSLNNCYGQKLTIDSDYGSLTKAAVKVAQKKEGITQDGIYGPVTGSHILWWANSSNGGPTKCVRV